MGSALLLVEDYQKSYTAALEGDETLLFRPYDECVRNLYSMLIYYGDAYMNALGRTGWNVQQVVPDCKALQYKWAKENSVSTLPDWMAKDPFKKYIKHIVKADPVSYTLQKIVLAQARSMKPDFIWAFSGVKCLTKPEMVDELRGHTSLLVLWWACPVSRKVPYGKFDLILSSIPTLVQQFEAGGAKAAYMPHAFDPRILARVPSRSERIPKAVFVGTLSRHHLDRVSFLDELSRHVEVDFYGTGVELLPEDSPLRRNARGPLWGDDLYEVYGRYLVVFHKNIGVAGQSFSAKRIFEATGMGACLITEASQPDESLFDPGSEIVTYSGLEDCVEKMAYLLKHPQEAMSIAQRGQRKTLSAHTYLNRVERLTEHLSDAGLYSGRN